MRKFLNNCKGAVTVFVTLLMIPAILVSGTAVDAARIYATRSSVQNANQLASNAALASYDSLLKDLYALFGFMSDDPELADMVNEYLITTIYGRDSDKGTFRSFFGSNTLIADIDCSGSMRDTEVLKQQILQYMRFRGPAILLKRIFGELEGGAAERIIIDNNILDTKFGLDEDLDVVLSMYRDLYNAIMQGDSVRARQGSWNTSVLDRVNQVIVPELEKIRSSFFNMNFILLQRQDEAHYSTTKWDELEAEYDSIVAGIRSSALLIEQTIEQLKEDAENFKSYYDKVVEIATELDNEKAALMIRVDILEQKLEAGDCSQEIYTAMMEPIPTDPEGRTLIEMYRDILQIEVLPFALRYREDSFAYIDDVLIPALDAPNFIRYRDNKKPVTATNSLTLDELKTLSSNPDFQINNPLNRSLYFAGDNDLPPEDPDCVDFLNLQHYLPETFYKFGNRPHYGDPQADFWERLEAMVAGGGTEYVDLFTGETKNGSDTESDQRDQINSLNGAGDGYETDSASSGAQRIHDPAWRKTDDSINLMSLADNIIKLISNPRGVFRDSVDYALILTYDMSMFSHYTTSKPNGGVERSITGIPMTPRVNYYYQSEWEYLLLGNKDAKDNLSGIRDLLLTIRGICNAAAALTITQINTIFFTLLALPIPFGGNIVVAGLALLAFIAAETALDVSRLRKGYSVALFKTDDTWICQPPFGRVPGHFDDNGFGVFSYENYLVTFFVAKAMMSSPSRAADVLVSRTADLIEWNCINYRYSINADEAEMTARLLIPNTFRLSNASTTINIETTVEMKMLFLSMPFAQKGINGVIPPRTLPISMSDVRGY